MAKRNSDGDVLLNRINVGLAKNQRLFGSLLGSKPEPESKNEKLEREREREDLEDEVIGPEQVGVGAPIPKDIKDGSFTRRALTSDDKLLQNLIGKKAAKAHIAAKQASRNSAKPQTFGKPERTSKPAESDDEEEGRTVVFKSKRQKTIKASMVTTDEAVDEQCEAVDTRIPHRPAADGDVPQDATLTTKKQKDSGTEDSNPKSRSQKSKPRSYLDELLAERSEKQKKKRSKGKAAS